ncbi:MAG: SufB/SufD family protein, partial [Acidimicrobiales bacterium]
APEDPRREAMESAEPDALAVLNRALSARPQLLRINGDLGTRPVVVINCVEAEGAAVFPRLVVEMGRSSRATVVEVFASADVASLVVPVTHLFLAPNADLSYLNLQAVGPAVWQIGLQVSQVGRDARLTSAAVALGGDYARLRTDSALVGEGCSSRLLAVYFGSGQQMHDFRTLQAHRAPHTTSNLLYKGAVANRARSVYSGLIRVEKGARATTAFQTNRNLVLHEGAHADSVPNLEIEDNDVRCSHASAVGPIDADQRFYLESRGVPTRVAERLIALGFLDDALAGIPVGGAMDPIRRQLAAKLADAEAQEEAW